MDSVQINILNQNGTIQQEMDPIPLSNLEDWYFGIDPLLELIVLLLESSEGVEETVEEYDENGEYVEPGVGIGHQYMYDIILVRNSNPAKKARAKRFEDVRSVFNSLLGEQKVPA